MRVRVCECEYSTQHPTNFRRHVKSCKARKVIIELRRENEELRKKPPVVSLVNVGHEDYSYIDTATMAKFIAHPPTAIQAMYQYVRRTPEHRNVLIPNKRENIVKVRSNGDWVLRDRKNFITPLVHAIADRISLAAERDDVTTLLGSEVVERWVRHHENVCNHARVLADTVNQVELVILSERMNS